MGLYMSRAERAVVLCCDSEEPGATTQPGLPLNGQTTHMITNAMERPRVRVNILAASSRNGSATGILSG
jgi:hypothetical protein